MSYLDWLMFIVCQNNIERESYQKLFKALLESEFTPIVENDQNRASDGLKLRLIYENELEEPCVMFGPCSVLEMLIALSIRCESDIMYDPDEGDRTHVWFWEMLDNMNLSRLDDWSFSQATVDSAVWRLNQRAYGSDGYGGPFYIVGFPKDMRKIELWYQLNYYICDRFM